MTLDEALTDIEQPRPQQTHSTTCSPNRKSHAATHSKAVRLLAEAYEHLRKRDPLYADRRRCASLAPPPASVPPD